MEDKDYGLPEVEYKPIERDQEPMSSNAATEFERKFSERNKQDKGGGPWGIIVGIVVLLAIGGGLLYFFVFNEETPAPVAQEEPVQQGFVVENEEEEENWVDESETIEETPVDETPAVATVDLLGSRTGKSYIIVGSFFDEDLAVDEGNKLAQGGVSTKVIPPFGRARFYRLAVGEFDSFREAAGNIEDYKSDFGENIWVLKY